MSINHQYAREGAALLRIIDPEQKATPDFFERILERGKQLVRETSEHRFNVGVMLIGLAEAANRQRGFGHGA